MLIGIAGRSRAFEGLILLMTGLLNYRIWQPAVGCPKVFTEGLGISQTWSGSVRKSMFSVVFAESGEEGSARRGLLIFSAFYCSVVPKSRLLNLVCA